VKARDTEEETDENREVVVLYLVSCSLKRIRFVPLLFTTTRAKLLLEVVPGDVFEEVVKMSRARIFVRSSSGRKKK
jgi:hypothetical protein